MVYKLVTINGSPKLKLSEDIDKVTLPGSKDIYRIYTTDTVHPSFDVIGLRGTPPPQEGKENEAVDTEKPKERMKYKPVKVELLNPVLFEGKPLTPAISMKEGQARIYKQLGVFDPAVIRRKDPVKYKVYLSMELFSVLTTLMASVKTAA